MTIDDLKIQLEARQDLEYLKGELRKHLEEHNFTTTELQREQFLDEVFAIIGDNIQVDGTDLSNLPVDQPDEQVDSQLESRLETLQVETDKLLVAIAELRRTAPETLRQTFALDVADLERMIPGIGGTLSPPEDSQAPRFDFDETTIDQLVATLSKLRNMNQSIPELVAKLKRAQLVFQDGESGTSHLAPTSRKSFKELNEMMHKQRRIVRQHDLAAKLLQQQ